MNDIGLAVLDEDCYAFIGRRLYQIEPVGSDILT